MGGKTVRGRIENKTDWPIPVANLVDQLVDDDSNTQAECYLLTGAPGKHSVTFAIFRIENVSPNVFETISEELELVETEIDHHRQSWYCDGIEPPRGWWTPQSSVNAVPFASKPRLDGEEGDLYYASYDPSENMLFLEYYFNF